MEIIWYGHACFKLKGKNSSVIIDPFDQEATGLKLPKELSANACLLSHLHPDHSNYKAVVSPDGREVITFSDPGGYEIGGIIITGIGSFHDSSGGVERGTNTIFQVTVDGVNIVHLGDFGEKSLNEDQLNQIGQTDILLVPVGSTYTIDGKVASEIVAQLEPKIVIPMHYAIEGLKFQLEGVENFLKAMGVENIIPQPKLSITKDKLPEETQVVVLSKS